VASGSGEVLAAAREAARDSTDIIGAIDRLSRALRERTGESLRTIRREPPLEQVTTPSLEALRKYTQARRVQLWEGDALRARELHDEAVALDSTFASSWRGISIYWRNQGNLPRAIEALERAMRHEHRLTERERLHTRANWHWYRQELPQALSVFERLIELDPRDLPALNNIGVVLEEIR
jgi:eukaryotic-like serine/threonine-protein kinase